MASTIAENWECMDYNEDYKNFEFSQVDRNILMSLLDETQIDHYDDQRLTDVIRSLEAEINSSGLYEFDNAIMGIDLVDCQSTNGESRDDNCLIRHDDLDLTSMDIMEIVPSTPNGGMSSWYVDHHVQEMADADEYGGAVDYSNFRYGNALAEQDYGSLWHDTIVTDMNN